jgi:hypothetical protein
LLQVFNLVWLRELRLLEVPTNSGRIASLSADVDLFAEMQHTIAMIEVQRVAGCVPDPELQLLIGASSISACVFSLPITENVGKAVAYII